VGVIRCPIVPRTIPGENVKKTPIVRARRLTFVHLKWLERRGRERGGLRGINRNVPERV